MNIELILSNMENLGIMSSVILISFTTMEYTLWI